MSENKVSRRDFLKGSAATAIGLLAASAIPAMAEEKKESAVPAPFQDKEHGASYLVDKSAMPHKNWDDPSLLIKYRWSGVNFNEVVLPNGKTIVIDPYFDIPDNAHNEHNYTPTDLPAGDYIHGADYVLLTHTHGDHCDMLPDVLRVYPAAQVFVPENAVPGLVRHYGLKYDGHYFNEVGVKDEFELDGFKLETIRGNHNLSKGATGGQFDPSKFTDANGNFDADKFFFNIYSREIMNFKITTKEGFTLLGWWSEMFGEQGFESRPQFFVNQKPDLYLYQVAGASLGYDRRNPKCESLGNWIAKADARIAMPAHQQHFSYEELDSMAKEFAGCCDKAGVTTGFVSPVSGVWYGMSKDKDGNVQMCLVDEPSK